MAVDPTDVASLLHRARRACADIATVRAETFQILAETRRLLTAARGRADAAQVERIAQERRESDRLAAQLAATKATARAVAHALNQPLAIIRGVAELIQTAPPDEPFAPDLVRILIATDHAAALVRDLVRVARYTTERAADGNPILDLSTAIDPPALLE